MQKVLDPHGTSWSILETVKKQEEDRYDDGKRGFRNHRHQRAHPSLL